MTGKADLQAALSGFAVSAANCVFVDTRRAEPGQGSLLRAVHVRAWVHTYAGMITDEVLQERLLAVRNRDWEEVIRRRVEVGEGVLTLIDRDEVIGLCEFGPTEDEDDDPSLTGHVFRLFIDPSQQGRGGGQLLLEAACGDLRAAAKEEATLWVFESDERARRLYDHLGWRPDGARHGVPAADIRYRLDLRIPQ